MWMSTQKLGWQHVNRTWLQNTRKMEHEKVRETILAYRYGNRDNLLVPFALGSLIVPPIAFVFFVFWIRAFILRREIGKTLLERLIVFWWRATSWFLCFG